MGIRMDAMSEMASSRYNGTISSTGSSNYYTTVTSAISGSEQVVFVNSFHEIKRTEEEGRYSVYEIADWFLNKGNMTQKKLQKLCYYAQAWCYALKNKRLIKSTFYF